MVRRIIASDTTAGYTPFSFGILYGWVVFGLLGIVAFFIKYAGGPNITLYFIPDSLEAATGFFIFSGASLMLLSTRNWEKINTSWKLDNIGMSLALGGWISYAIGISAADWTRIGSITICLMFAVAIIVRYIFTYTYEKFIRMRVSRLWNHG